MQQQVFKFSPIIKEKVWGGTKLKKLLHKKVTTKLAGESWEITAINKSESVVTNGADKGKTLTALIKQYKGDLVGQAVYKKFKDKFPLLIKFIDAKENLSIQLHPNNKIAKQKHKGFGKTEMWYVMQADKKSELIVGFKDKVTKSDFLSHITNNSIKSLLNIDYVKKNDVYFIEPGLIHAIGAGVMLAEIQQTSDITYRIYDWNRKDINGKLRKLHTNDALNAINFEVKKNYTIKYKSKKNKTVNLVDCKYFTTNLLKVNNKVKCNHNKKDSFIIYICVKGNVTFAINNKITMLNYGETLLIPNSLKIFEILSKEKSKLLEVYIK